VTPAPAPTLQPVPLQELRQQGGRRHWSVDQPIADLPTLTPVRGEISAEHCGQALELRAHAETILTLCCDRCLQQFNQPLTIEVTERLELAQAPDASSQAPSDPFDLLEVAEALDDRLEATGNFDPERWLFEQLSLRLPQINRCGSACPGPARWSSEPPGVDPRWAALRQLDRD